MTFRTIAELLKKSLVRQKHFSKPEWCWEHFLPLCDFAATVNVFPVN